MATKDKSAPDADEQKALATAGGTDIVEADFFDGAGEGMEDFGQKDFTVPFIGIIQALSKAVQKNHSNYVQGAEQGMLLNSATRAVYDGDEGIIVVPVHFEHRYVAWKPNNGGIAHDYGSNSEIYDSITPNDKGQRLDPEGNEIVDTMQYFVLIIDPEAGTMEAAVLPFSKIHAKKSKKWNNLIRNHVEMRNGKPTKPAMYFYAYKLTTIAESNEKGSWYSHNIVDFKKLPDMGPFGSMVFNAAKELRAQVAAGEVRAATEAPEEGSGAAASGDGDGAF